MVRRPVAWVVAVVLFVEALGIALLNWFLGVIVDRQHMSLAGLDPNAMSVSSKAGGVVFGLYFGLCGLVALLVGVRDRSPAGLGRILLISVAVVHGLLGAFAWGLVGRSAFLFMMGVLGLIVLLLMTYDRREGPADAVDADGDPKGNGDPKGDGDSVSPGPAPVTPPAPSTP
ncbi:hypothetical protein AQJ43_02700 [Streptomyces avermitilis]|uniref:hypothetical protein n=1 Tax=Streptomyces sp. SID5469 TaxID=2690296 RepID=UPI0005AA4920|nr:hypothetical protein [Streptomyces avermitilis]KUN56528.1 hypothetical protein AQJ43_02700 [Streptomyces avermitilis]MYS98936.1 hypothetical protein [Streptomyces sp. SID5469]